MIDANSANRGVREIDVGLPGVGDNCKCNGVGSVAVSEISAEQY